MALMQQFRYYFWLKKDQKEYQEIAKKDIWLKEMRSSGKKEKEQGTSW